MLRIIPAYAGSTTQTVVSVKRWQDHPRIRGEHSCSSWPCASCRGSSPHTRGAPAAGAGGFQLIGIIPAYAGSTSTASKTRCRPRDHPRIRGEHEGLGQWSRRDMGSSPHTRGARDRPIDVGFELGIIPAYAGSTSRNCESPRASVGSSPHTRGAPAGLPADFIELRIIPAYAGSTASLPQSAMMT